MIGRLAGVLVECTPGAVLLDVGGVGYRLQIPLSTFYRIATASGAGTVLHVHTHVREDALSLFGFATPDELETFQRLISVSGVGPKLALAVLSGIDGEGLRAAVTVGDRAKLERIPGVGRKTAERILLELKETPRAGRGRKPAPPSGPPTAIQGSVRSDAVSALVNLGYAGDPAERSVDAALADPGIEPRLEIVLRAALRGLVR
jgi:Holliday junction DNA helicase RuvA